MAKYRLKRKTFGVIGNAVGGVTEGVGNVLDSGAGKTVAGLAGVAAAPSILGGIGGAMAGKGLAGAVGKAAGTLAGAVNPVARVAVGLGTAAIAGGIGKALKKAGDNMQS